MNDRNRKLKELIEKHTRKATSSLEVALRSLIDSGIYSKDGSLAPEYGGTPKKGPR